MLSLIMSAWSNKIIWFPQKYIRLIFSFGTRQYSQSYSLSLLFKIKVPETLSNLTVLSMEDSRQIHTLRTQDSYHVSSIICFFHLDISSTADENFSDETKFGQKVLWDAAEQSCNNNISSVSLHTSSPRTCH